MKYLNIGIVLLAISIITSCSFTKNAKTYESTTESFIEALKQEDFDTCLSLMQMENGKGQRLNPDTLRVEFTQFKRMLNAHFGEKPYEYEVVKWEKTLSTNPEESTPTNATRAFVEFNNGDELGVFQLLFDDTTNKVLDIRALDIKVNKPDLLLFWLLGLIPLAVVLFNIYIIREIKRSNLQKKWLKYLAVILLNVPTFTYTAAGNATFHLLSFQFLFGAGFSGQGIIESAWSVGLPLGGLYWLWMLKRWK
ncbi:hypothetical protein H4K35_14925 [Myroides sp. NP-2]|uniref:hypothetical protein n=1 Tax=Myroides sp. NP-2 TaxID=2759945 RepID=UPI0015FE3F3A|nr:hypothetical protein [Myroides sp. NP-2]MBB1151378.1 hypothetical protein [Myroides sp. NP-2]